MLFQPLPGYYRLSRGVRLVSQDESVVAVCDYPPQQQIYSRFARKSVPASNWREQLTCPSSVWRPSAINFVGRVF